MFLLCPNKKWPRKQIAIILQKLILKSEILYILVSVVTVNQGRKRGLSV